MAKWRRLESLFGFMLSWLPWYRRRSRDADLARELRDHLHLEEEDQQAAGLSPEQASSVAHRAFGNTLKIEEDVRHAWGFQWLESLIQDLRYGLRMLRKSPGFTAVAVLTLALGIGANTAIFSVVDTILLRPLPFRDPQQLARIVEKNPKAGESSKTYSADATQDFQELNRSFQSVSGYFAFTPPDNFKLVGKGQPIPVTGMLVAEGFFQTLGVTPSLGRLFRPEEFVKHAQPVALLSYLFWKRQFGGDHSIVGRTINLSNTSVTVVGVLPDSFDFGSVFSPGAKVDLFAPYVMDDFRDDGNDLALVGRLKQGVTLAQAQSEADQLFPQLYFEHHHPAYGKGYTGQLTGLKEYVSGKLRRSLIVLWCAVGLILLIVCVNLSNLLLARGATRSKEFAMRSALGASRARLVRQMSTESLILAGVGGALGLGTAYVTLSYLSHQGSIALPLLITVRVDGTVLAWTVLIAVAAAVLFGLIPGLRMSGVNLQETLKEAGHGAGESRKHERMRSALVVTEIALACVLLVGAGLLLRSFLRVLDVDLGFEPSHAAAISVDYDDGGNAAKRAAIWQDIVGRASMIPGVEAAGVSDNLPMSRNRSWGIAAKGEEQKRNALDYVPVFVYIVSPGYLRAMGMRLIAGRDISWEDLFDSRSVVIINETVARRLWPGRDPVGRIAYTGGTEAEVIGVIADVRESGAEDNAGAQMYLPATKQFGPEGANLVVRSKLPPSALAKGVMSTLRQINPGQPATGFNPIQDLVDHATSPRRFLVLLVGTFACLGVLLASLGIYGVVSYSVARQTHEIGIRMALGATESRVQIEVIWKTLRLALIGISLGVIGSLAIARLISSLLFRTAPTDSLTFVSMVVLLGTVALLACYIPARRAMKVDPMVALRYE